MNWLHKFMAPWVAREVRKRGKQMSKEIRAHRVGTSHHYMNRPNGQGIWDRKNPRD